MKNPTKTLLRQIRNNQFWKKLGFWHYVIIFGAALGFCGLYLYLGARGYFVGGDDALFHISRYQSVLAGWRDGQIIPQINPDFLSGIGHSWNIFYGPLPAYLVAGLFLIIGSWQISIALAMLAVVFLSGVVMYRLVGEISFKEKKVKLIALIGAIIYVWSPYLVIDIYGRHAMGEAAAFIFIPLIFHGLWRLVKSRKNSTLLLVLGGVGLMLSHFLSVVIVAVFAGLFLLLNIRQILPIWKKVLSRILIAVVAILGLSAFFIVPFLENMNLGIYAINNSWFTENVLSFNVRSIHNYRLDPLHPYVETRNFGFYLAVIAAALAAAIAVFRKPKNDLKSDQKRYLLLLAVALVLSSTLIDWNLVPEMFYSIQFPTRFLGIASMFMAVAASFGICWLVDKIKISWLKWSVLGVFIGAIAVAGWCRIPSGLDHQHIADDLSTTTMTGQNEYYTMGFLKDGFSTELADSGKLFEVYGDAEVSDFQVFQGKSRREFTVAAETDAKVELTQVYYAGYQAIDSAGDRLPTTYSEHGLVEISIPAGYNGKVASSFRNSDLTVIGMVVSATSLATLIGYAIVRWRRRK